MGAVERQRPVGAAQGVRRRHRAGGARRRGRTSIPWIPGGDVDAGERQVDEGRRVHSVGRTRVPCWRKQVVGRIPSIRRNLIEQDHIAVIWSCVAGRLA